MPVIGSGETCVCCGAVIPEGTQVCRACSAILKEDGMSVKNGVWHDAKLDPPKEAGTYLVATDRGAVTVGHWYPPRKINGITIGGKFSGPGGSHITHWMPRPEPPEKK